MGDGWAWVSLGAYGSAISADDLSRQCLKGRLTDKMTCWRLLNFRAYQQAGICTASSRNCRVILGDTGSALLAIRERADCQLRIGWSPMSPQESLVFPASLISGLAELGVDIMLDGYGS